MKEGGNQQKAIRRDAKDAILKIVINKRHGTIEPLKKSLIRRYDIAGKTKFFDISFGKKSEYIRPLSNNAVIDISPVVRFKSPRRKGHAKNTKRDDKKYKTKDCRSMILIKIFYAHYLTFS